MTDALDKRCEDLQFHNLTLLDDKKQLQETLDQLRGAEGNDAAGGGLEREIRELQDSLHQKVRELRWSALQFAEHSRVSYRNFIWGEGGGGGENCLKANYQKSVEVLSCLYETWAPGHPPLSGHL